MKSLFRFVVLLFVVMLPGCSLYAMQQSQSLEGRMTALEGRVHALEVGKQ